MVRMTFATRLCWGEGQVRRIFQIHFIINMIFILSLKMMAFAEATKTRPPVKGGHTLVEIVYRFGETREDVIREFGYNEWVRRVNGVMHAFEDALYKLPNSALLPSLHTHIADLKKSLIGVNPTIQVLSKPAEKLLKAGPVAAIVTITTLVPELAAAKTNDERLQVYGNKSMQFLAGLVGINDMGNGELTNEDREKLDKWAESQTAATTTTQSEILPLSAASTSLDRHAQTRPAQLQNRQIELHNDRNAANQ